MRAKCIDFWIEVAHECFNIGNFNSLMAITTALNLSSISRLKKTVSSCDWILIYYNFTYWTFVYEIFSVVKSAIEGKVSDSRTSDGPE